MVTDHQHIEMFFQRVDRVRPRWICGRRQNILLAADFDNIRRMTTARTLGVEGVNGAALKGIHRGFDKTGFIQRVRVDQNLHVIFVGHSEAIVDGRWRGAPVFVQL